MKYVFLCLLCPCFVFDAQGATERQLTNSPSGKILTNTSVWSSDGEWIVFDTRANPGKFDATRIERVNARTGEVQCLYEAREGAVCGVVTYHPSKPRVVFIYGPENPTPDWTYGPSRRRGVVVDVRRQGEITPLDAMNYAPPFHPGALRGGSHVHIFSQDGTRVSFTYDDEVLSRLAERTGDDKLNQRNVGVAVELSSPVVVNTRHPRNQDGRFFSVLVTHTVATPRPGSDEISRACEEGWVGNKGYQRTDGSQVPHALAFQGLVTSTDGSQHYEVYIVDLPEDLTQPGDEPLEGTAIRRPAPPRGTVQRRLTFTSGRRYPGVQGPRHWLRSSPDGSRIAFLMKDDSGIVQIWSVSPNGGEPVQITRNSSDVQSAFTWSPDGRQIAYVMDNSIFVSNVETKESTRLTARTSDENAPLPYACVFSPTGREIAFQRNVTQDRGGGAQIFTVSVDPAP